MNGTSLQLAQDMHTRSVNDFVAEGGRVLASDDNPDHSAIRGEIEQSHAPFNRHTHTARGLRDIDDCSRRLMSAFSVHYDGRSYRWNGYRYDRLADAVAYAELMQARQSSEVGPDPFTGTVVSSPSAYDEKVMAAMAITFAAGVYSYRGFHYDRLLDAVEYARVDVRGGG